MAREDCRYRSAMKLVLAYQSSWWEKFPLCNWIPAEQSQQEFSHTGLFLLSFFLTEPRLEIDSMKNEEGPSGLCLALSVSATCNAELAVRNTGQTL